MTQDFDDIDNYLKGLLNPDELKIFDQRLINEPAFAQKVAFYVNAQNAALALAHEEKRNRFRQIQSVSTLPKSNVVKLWLPYVAAAVLIGAISLVLIFYFNNPSPTKLSHQFIEREFTTLGVTMNATEDSVEHGVRLYNEGKFDQALTTYEKVIQRDSGDHMAIKYAGIVSLRLKQYDEALGYFLRLQNIPLLHANAGKFYSAITLMERNQASDLPRAKKLLQQVVDNNLEGRDTAENWLQDW